MKFLLPLVLLLVGSGAGMGVGFMLRSAPAETVAGHLPQDAAETQAHAPDKTGHGEASSAASDYVQLNNQFVVPIVAGDLVESLVVLSLAIELQSGKSETVYHLEPKLRDALLQVMFDHANIGGFRGRFTDDNNMDVLRAALTEAAQAVIGEAVTGVVITDIARQEV